MIELSKGPQIIKDFGSGLIYNRTKYLNANSKEVSCENVTVNLEYCLCHQFCSVTLHRGLHLLKTSERSYRLDNMPNFHVDHYQIL